MGFYMVFQSRMRQRMRLKTRSDAADALMVSVGTARQAPESHQIQLQL
jgi:hypothetical protein